MKTNQVQEQNTLRKNFKQFLNSYLEEQKICFYIPVQEDNSPIAIIAKRSLSDEAGFFYSFLNLFNLENKVENTEEIVNKFKALAQNFIDIKSELPSLERLSKGNGEEFKMIDAFTSNSKIAINIDKIFN